MPGPSEKDILDQVRKAAELFFADMEQGRVLSSDWMDRGIADAWIDVTFEKCLQRLAATGCWGQSNQLPSSEFWRIAEPWLQKGVLQHRARFKPRGYAGDYEMLDWICTGRCCEDPLGGAFDRYFQRQGAPQAVRGRTEQVAAAVAVHCLQSDTDEYAIVSVGSGPAGDVFRVVTLLPEQHRNRLRVSLLDLDPEALEFAYRRLQAVLSAEAIQCQHENLFRLPKRKDHWAVLGRPNAIICSGLFDYLEDAEAHDMLAMFWQQLAPGGLLLVWNFAPHNPTRAYMEWIGNWYLRYRTADELRQLGSEASIPEDQFHIGGEPLGIDLALVGQKGINAA